MKAIAICGSPRKNWNTDILCQKALEGAAAAGAETELIYLYDYQFKGCMSCFNCHLKTSMDKYICAYNDELTPVLQKCLDADVIIIGSPVYYAGASGMVRSFLERLLFPLDTYYADENDVRVVKRGKTIPTAMIYSMNANPEQLKFFKIDQFLINNVDILEGIFGYCEPLYCCDTYQFADYSLYTVNIFDPQHKAEVRDNQFPVDCQNAFELGKRLVQKSIELA